MARSLKTYVTTAGFFDLAIAAPSMKAALEAWGAGSNLFQQGFARVSHDPAIVKATRARPGVVLRRAVGTTDRFSERAPLPKDIPVAKRPPPAGKPTRTTQRSGTSSRPVVRASRARADAQPPAQERARQERARRREERARQKQAEKRQRAIAAAEAALENARREHETRLAEIDRARSDVEDRAAREAERWQRKRAALEQGLRAARGEP